MSWPCGTSVTCSTSFFSAHQSSKVLLGFGMSSGHDCSSVIKSKLKASSSQHFRNSTLITPCPEPRWRKHGGSGRRNLRAHQRSHSSQRRAAQAPQHHPRGNTFLGGLETKGKVENPAQKHPGSPWASQERNQQTRAAPGCTGASTFHSTAWTPLNSMLLLRT